MLAFLLERWTEAETAFHSCLEFGIEEVWSFLLRLYCRTEQLHNALLACDRVLLVRNFLSSF